MTDEYVEGLERALFSSVGRLGEKYVICHNAFCCALMNARSSQ